MPMIDTERLKLQLDDLAAAEALRNSVNSGWKNAEDAQKLKDAPAFMSLLEDAERNYLRACERLAWALAREIDRAAAE